LEGAPKIRSGEELADEKDRREKKKEEKGKKEKEEKWMNEHAAGVGRGGLRG
jgi:hypothetical protein